MSAPTPVMRIEGFDADGNAKAFESDPAVRVLHFDASYIVSINTSVQPNRIEVTSRVNAATLAILLERIELTSTGLRFKNTDGDTTFEYGADAGNPTIGFFGQTPQQQQGVSLGSGTLATDIANALHSSRIITAT